MNTNMMNDTHNAVAADDRTDTATKRGPVNCELPEAWQLFYSAPEPLSSTAHATWRIKPAGVGFAAHVNSVPVVIGEFAAAMHSYPVVFAGAEHTPVALLGLDRRNRFVKDDVWQPGAYVPAYVRRYPFAFAQVDRGFALAIDAQAPNLVKDSDAGQPLFENGKPSQITLQALQFCEAFAREDAATREFVDLLLEQKLLVERTADITLPQGRKSTLAGFSVVPIEAFTTLPESVVVEWHRQGWLALVHSHLLSLARFADLLAG